MRVSLVAVVVLGCSGPPAPDAAVCRDLVTRLCMDPICEPVTSSLGVDAGTCEATLLQRTGCQDEGFAFTAPNRAEVLDCRVPLLRQGSSQKVHPACADVAEAFTLCPQLVRFLGGAQ